MADFVFLLSTPKLVLGKIGYMEQGAESSLVKRKLILLYALNKN